MRGSRATRYHGVVDPVGVRDHSGSRKGVAGDSEEAIEIGEEQLESSKPDSPPHHKIGRDRKVVSKLPLKPGVDLKRIRRSRGVRVINSVQELRARHSLEDIDASNRQIHSIADDRRRKLAPDTRQEVQHIGQPEIGRRAETEESSSSLGVGNGRARQRLKTVTRRTVDDPLVEIKEADVRRDVVKRNAGAHDRLLLLTRGPDKPERRIEILVVLWNLAEIVSKQGLEVLREIDVVVEDIILERPAQTVVHRQARTDLPRVLAVEANVIVSQNVVEPERSRLSGIADSYA